VRQANVCARRIFGVLIVLCAGICVNTTGGSTLEAAQPQRWKGIHFSTGQLGAENTNDPCDFNRRLRSDAFDILVESDQMVFTLAPINYSWRTCPSARREVTITRVGFSRGSRKANKGIGGDMAQAAVAETLYLLRPKTVSRYFLSLDYREPGGDSASATFYFEEDPSSLLKAIIRIGKVPVQATASDAALLDRDIDVSASPDPHRRLLANVPIWESQARVLEGPISQIVSDGSAALADGAIWDLPAGTLRRRMPQQPTGTRRELLAGDARWLLRVRNSGPINGKDVMRAGEVTIIDTMTAASVARIGPLPYIDNLLMAPHATLALVFPLSLKSPAGVSESTVSAISLDRGQIVWRASVPSTRGARVGPSDGDRVLAFGKDWIRLWNGATGDTLYDSIAVLKQLAEEQGPVAIVDAASLGDRVIVVYTTMAGMHIASIDLKSGRALNNARLSGALWWSPDRNILLAASSASLTLWDTDTLRVIGDLNPQPGKFRLFAGFDASGELLATMRNNAEGLDGHVVITNARTRKPVGQCLLGDVEGMHLASDGRTVFGYHDSTLLSCRRAD